MPRNNCGLIELQPPAGRRWRIATTEFTTGAPANTMDMTTAGVPFAPNASSTQNAPSAPTIPATNDQATPPGLKLHEAPLSHNTASGASTAVRKYATPTHRNAL